MLIAFCRCDSSEETFSNVSIVYDNAQAVMYFHTVFQETENTWAFVHGKVYEELVETFERGQTHKKITVTYDIDEEEIETNTATVEYNEWETNGLKLTGAIRIVVDKNSYRRQNQAARVSLFDFFINGHSVTGIFTVIYRNAERDEEDEEAEDENDLYFFNVLDGANIREGRANSSALISATIRNGSYERLAGGETFSPDDDVWRYWGNMTGTLRDNANMRYTNTVVSTVTVDGETIDVALRFAPDCRTARQGLSVITIAGRDDIMYVYGCDEIYYETETHKIRN